MPAIEVSQLRARINLLTKLVDTPAQLVQELTRFYESYSDLTFQSGLFSVRAGDLPAYRTPVLMNRELETALTRSAEVSPDNSLAIIDLLAVKPQVEPRQLACTMLGTLSDDYFPQVVQHLADWAHTTEEPEDLIWIFKRGSARIRRESPEMWLKMLQSWLESSDPKYRQVAVYGLTSMINDTSLTSLPLIFKYLQPLLIEANVKILPHLETILERLIEKSENETLFFLKQVLRQSKNQTITRMVRRSLPLFSPEGQESLRTFLRSL